MEIKLAENGMWGGEIPDILRNDRISLLFDKSQLVLKLSGEEWEKLRKLLDKETQELYNKAEKIVKRSDAKDNEIRKMRPVIEKLWAYRESEVNQIGFELIDIYNEYWEK